MMEIMGVYGGLSVLAWMVSLVAVHFAPVGYEDESGFHYGVEGGSARAAEVRAPEQVLPQPV
jgi:hypothetical protein